MKKKGRRWKNKKMRGRNTLMWMHGGGWCIGEYWHVHQFALNIAKQFNILIISIEYRLAPEFKFPFAVNDAYDNLLWISQNAGSFEGFRFKGDTNQIVVGGHSAGGNLAIVVTFYFFFLLCFFFSFF